MTWELVGLAEVDPDQALAAQSELAPDGFAFLPFHAAGEAWPAYVARVLPMSRGVGLPPGYVPWTDLYGVVEGVLVGRVSVRHRLTPALAREGGHIGYGVRPAHRRRGYATAFLRAGLGVAARLGIERALVTCDDTNIGSATVIERCGGVLEDVVASPGGAPKRRYWVATG
ncbi:GNAT family N-acetyltransferase [Actinotalea sp. M2MS4P-6]|uniref:GNAT family N-acetyltransferase n=1 Tax=Actinotalea sp. M2MS4P-6 TaxID=2983762 RepID=UPI0021E39C57|nr:GNAT family N-acetyltransferase [Actinotalea sp. M2MS4P-6]MCV2392897.1 GNAT family N-acetyltransferase [Actinotalea sp. M2MS4P-6]